MTLYEFQNETIDYTYTSSYSRDEMNIMMDIIHIIDITDEDLNFEYLIRKPVIDDLKYIQIILTKNSKLYTMMTYYYIVGECYFECDDVTVVDRFSPNLESIIEYLKKLKD
jgi:hypothetical protein